MAWLLVFILALFPQLRASTAAAVEPNDNLTPAGRLGANELAIRLYAGTGVWHPKGASGPGINVAAFGEEASALTTPGPLIRARVGTNVVVTLRNTLDGELRVFGLCSKPGPCDPIFIAAGAARQIRFSLNAAGTFHYWASRSSTALATRALGDTQLGGAIVVDPVDGPSIDRVMIISLYVDAATRGGCQNLGDDTVLAINGATWPHTTRLRYVTGETAHWRVINLSCDQHAMHLHGFHFTVDAAGDGLVDQPLIGDSQRTEVTEFMPSGRTASISWTPSHAGNWLFHCHMVGHMTRPASQNHPDGDMVDDAGMAGLVVGIEVTGPDTPTAPAAPARRLTMTINEDADRYGKGLPGFRVAIDGADAPRISAGPVPGPILVLHRGEPTEITVVNRTTQSTAIHWHGLEIDSYFDGVPGFSGMAGHVAPPIASGQSFVVTMTPPRAGTYMYHTHWHDEAQLAGGIYGPLLVLEPGAQYDPAVDHILMIGFNGVVVAGEREPFALNGRAVPEAISLRAGVPNRLRLINITANNAALTGSLVSQFDTVQWTALAKDGAALVGEQRPRLARQLVSVGETYDFEVTPARPQSYWFDFRRGSGEWVAQVELVAK